MQEIDIDKLSEITATCHYNSERKYLLEPVIRKFLLNPSSDFTISQEIHRNTTQDSFLETIFKQQDYIITSSLDYTTVIEYIISRYGNYNEAFTKKYNISLEMILYITKLVWKIYAKRIYENPFIDQYQFSSRKEYGDLDFFEMPNKKYISEWKRLSIISVEDILCKNEKLTEEIINIFLDLYSFDIKKIQKEPDLRFRNYPLFYYDNKIFLIEITALLRYLPHKIDQLLAKCKSYVSNKGKEFENIVLDLIENTPKSTYLAKNIEYDGYELDGLLTLKRSTWFVECKSRNLSSKTLKGDRNKIQKDIDKSIRAAIKQGIRAIKYKDTKYFKKYKMKNIIGILVIVEGIFPNFRNKIVFPDNPIDQCKYPVCVFNYFDLKEILSQYDAASFENFIIWRSQKNIPIFCLDECDYWDFYTKMIADKERKEDVRHMRRNNNTCIYIGNRFNDKNHISNILDEYIL